MNEPAVPNGQPPYWDDCKGKTFDQLAEFIEEAREKLSDPASDADLPRSLEEFRALCEMLREKYEAEKPQRKQAPLSDRLMGKYARRKRLVERRDDLRKTLRSKEDKKKRRAINQEIDRLKQSIWDVDEVIHNLKEGGDYPRGSQGYTGPSLHDYHKIRGAVENAFEPRLDVPTTYLPWVLAPPSSTSETTLREPPDSPQGRGRLAGVDPERLENLISLKPNHRYEDPEGIDGYSVFTFDWTPKALMECLNRNNAMFVLGEDMEVWPKGDKQELRDHPSVTWIPHREGWREKLKEALAPSND